MFILKQLYLYILFFLLSLQGHTVFAQNCNSEISAGLTCSEAPFICDINRFCDRLPVTNRLPRQDGLCGTVENGHWVGFTATWHTMLFLFTVSNCENGPGIKGALYLSGTCDDLVQVAPCWENTMSRQFLYIVENLDIGQSYLFQISGEEGAVCDYQINIMAGNFPLPATANAGLPEIICENASLQLDGTQSNMGENFSYEWVTEDGNIVSGANTLTPIINAPGDYVLTVLNNNNNCADTDTVQVTLTETSARELAIPNEVSIDFGEQLQIVPETNFAPYQINQATWIPANSISCPNCLITQANPARSTLYQLIVEDLNGCTYIDSIFVNVLNAPRRNKVFLPNIFSPNGDGNNDFLFVSANLENVRAVLSFEVYDRWGNRVFNRKLTPLNSEIDGWDGRSVDGQLLPTGVYVVQFAVLFVGGNTEIFHETVTLVR